MDDTGREDLDLVGAIRTRECPSHKYINTYETIELPRELLQNTIIKLLDRAIKLLDRANRAESESKYNKEILEYMNREFENQTMHFFTMQRDIKQAFNNYLLHVTKSESTESWIAKLLREEIKNFTTNEASEHALYSVDYQLFGKYNPESLTD